MKEEIRQRMKKFLADEKEKVVDMKKLATNTDICYQTLYMFKRGMANPRQEALDTLDSYLKSKGY